MSPAYVAVAFKSQTLSVFGYIVYKPRMVAYIETHLAIACQRAKPVVTKYFASLTMVMYGEMHLARFA